MQPDAACVTALVELSEAMNERGINLVLVFPPLHPEYREAYPNAVPAICRIAREVELATRRHNTDLLVLPRDADFGGEDFFDAFHLQYTAVKRLSAQVARRVEQSLASIGHTPPMTGESQFRNLRRSCGVNEARNL